MNLEGCKPFGRSKKTWKKCVREDLNILELEESGFQKRLIETKNVIKPLLRRNK